MSPLIDVMGYCVGQSIKVIAATGFSGTTDDTGNLCSVTQEICGLRENLFIDIVPEIKLAGQVSVCWIETGINESDGGPWITLKAISIPDPGPDPDLRDRFLDGQLQRTVDLDEGEFVVQVPGKRHNMVGRQSPGKALKNMGIPVCYFSAMPAKNLTIGIFERTFQDDNDPQLLTWHPFAG